MSVQPLAAASPVQDVVALYADAMPRSMKTARRIAPDATRWRCCDGWFLAGGDKAMLWLTVIFLLILLIAPVRKAFFSAWRFTLPAMIGFVFTVVMIRCVMKMNLPSLMVLGISTIVAIEAGVVGQHWFNETFGSNRQR
jgi:hypothetical protein